MALLDLSSFEQLFQKGENFEITEEQYEEKVKKKLPQTNYLKKRSPVARKARDFGYKLHVEERIHRVLVFTKNENEREKPCFLRRRAK